jgi:two-component system C4-dicarboxylate transport response regulator DctD
MDLYEKLQNMKIALVEDDTLLRESMVLYFRTKGCTVAGFADADAAMEAFGKGFPDIVISDHFLPGPDGLALLRRIGERHPGTLRILITGHPSPEITRQVEQAGIDEFLLKPFSIEEMEEGLRRLLKKRRKGMGDCVLNT